MNATTDSNGRAEVTLRSSAIRGIATVTARETGVDVTGATAVRFENGAATQLTTMLEALRIGTRETTQFIATAIDSNGNPVEGEAIAFDVVSGAGAFAESSVITDSNGRAIGNFTAGPSAETVTLRARTAGGLSSSAQLTVGVAALTVLSSSPVLVSSADTQDEGVTISAQVRDGSNVLQEGISVTFSSDSGALQVVNGETDASGTARATLITAGDPSNRRINVIATAEGRSNTVAVDVIGTRLTLDGPRAIQNGVANSYVVTLLDSSGAPVALRSVAFSAKGATLSGTTLTTDAQGRGTVQLTATAGLTARLTATALGASVSVDISVTNDSLVFVPPTGAVGCTNPKPFARLGDIPVNANRTIRALWCRLGEPVVGQPVTFTTTRGAFGGSSSVTANTGADGIASVVIRAAQAGRATVQAVGNDPNPDPTRTGEPASTPFSTIDGEFVAKVPASVDVQADPSVIGVEQESTITAVVRDAANNLVKNSTVNFTLNDVTGGTLSAGAAVTDSQGRVSVVYRASATTSGQGGVRIIATVSGTTITDEARLTVGGQTLRIVLGTGNELFESDDTTRYEVPYTALVTDSAGNPVPGAVLSMTGFPEKYLKGFYPGVPGAWVRTVTAICDNEDKNENGILDPGEDTNNNGILDPANVATVPFQPPVDGTGIASFRIVYPQDRGNWIDDFRLSARARVAGTEATEIVRFPLPISADDATGEGSPPGAISPFGIIGRCDLTDNQVPRVTIAAASTTQVVAESAGIVQITVRVDRAFNEDILVPIDVGLAGDTATPGIDYEAPPSVRIPAGSISGTFNVKVLADSESEGDEIATFSLGTPLTNNALLSNVTAASLIITDVSDSQPRVSISPVDQGVISVSSAVGSFPIRVRMDNVASQDVLIPISVGGASDSAESGQDFSAATSVRIPAGSRSATFPIQIFQDGDSNDEIFTVTLGEASSGNARLGAPVSTRVIIVVDNQLPRVSIPAAGRNRTVAENAGTVSITVRMDRTATTDVRVPVFFGSEEDTATICDPTSVRCNDQPGTGDYSAAASDIVRIPAGSTSGTLVVSIHDDSTDENNESFTLTLGDPLDGNALLLNRDASRISRVVITDNDLPPTPSP